MVGLEQGGATPIFLPTLCEVQMDLSDALGHNPERLQRLASGFTAPLIERLSELGLRAREDDVGGKQPPPSSQEDLLSCQRVKGAWLEERLPTLALRRLHTDVDRHQIFLSANLRWLICGLALYEAALVVQIDEGFEWEDAESAVRLYPGLQLVSDRRQASLRQVLTVFRVRLGADMAVLSDPDGLPPIDVIDSKIGKQISRSLFRKGSVEVLNRLTKDHSYVDTEGESWRILYRMGKAARRKGRKNAALSAANLLDTLREDLQREPPSAKFPLGILADALRLVVEELDRLFLTTFPERMQTAENEIQATWTVLRLLDTSPLRQKITARRVFRNVWRKLLCDKLDTSQCSGLMQRADRMSGVRA